MSENPLDPPDWAKKMIRERMSHHQMQMTAEKTNERAARDFADSLNREQIEYLTQLFGQSMGDGETASNMCAYWAGMLSTMGWEMWGRQEAMEQEQLEQEQLMVAMEPHSYVACGSPVCLECHLPQCNRTEDDPIHQTTVAE